MAEPEKIRARVAAVVSDLLQQRLPSLGEEFVRRVMVEVESQLTPHTATSDLLERAMRTVHAANSQGEILTALLEATASFSTRAAIFVLRGGSAALWQSRGFRDPDALRNFNIDPTAGLAGQALQQRQPATGAMAQFDGRFAALCGVAGDGRCLVLPLIISSKVVALVYADAGFGGQLDGSALQLLTRATGLWIEILALRKTASGANPNAPGAPQQAPDRPSPEFSAPAPAPAVAAQADNFSSPVGQPPLPGAGLAASPMLNRPVAKEEDIHSKARRFAKLLVDEVKLYNQSKVAEGKQNRDLYLRLKDDLDKSRAMYDKRYANTPAEAGDYFTSEVLRNLADNDPALLGSNFPQ